MQEKQQKNTNGQHPLSGQQQFPQSADERKAPSVKEVEIWLINRLSTSLKVSPNDIDVEKPFARYGLGSVEAIVLTQDLEDWIGRRLPATLAWDYPNISTLAKYLGEHAMDIDYQEFIEEGANEEYEVR